MDISAIASALSSITAATEIVKLLRSGTLTLEKAEAQLKLAEVIVALAEAKVVIADLQGELAALRERVETIGSMEHKDNAYWRKRPDGTLEGPFCPKCRDGAGKAARMSDRDPDPWWRCPVCKHLVLKPGQEEPLPFA